MTTPTFDRCSRCGTVLSAETAGGLCPKCLMAVNFESRTVPEAGEPARSAAPTPEEIREKFPQFEILEYLGRGGMGVVYKARQRALDRVVAIKILAREWQGDPDFAARFEREAKLLAQMAHPNIVTVHDFGEAGGLYYLAMEFVDGVNMRDLLGDGKLEPEQALAIVPPICEALQYAHGKGVVHRDIKPENLLLDREGRVKIADFGIASLVGAPGERTGTPPYMAPEQESGRTDERADIYSLGVVLYEMLTGERPTKELVAPSRKARLDVRIDEMVLRALEKDPERRYQTVDEFWTDLATVAWSRASGPSPEKRKRGSGRSIAWGLAALLVIVVALGPLRAYLRLPSGGPDTLAASPQALKAASTAKVIEAGLAAPDLPWPWNELERRNLSREEAATIVDGLTSRLLKHSPAGMTEPMPWTRGIIEHLLKKRLIAEDRRIAFAKSVQGDIRLDTLPRLRIGTENLHVLHVRGEWRYLWDEAVMGLVMMNELQQVTVDGNPLEVGKPRAWGESSFLVTVPVAGLKPGNHVIELEVHSELTAEENLLGLSPNAPAGDWPVPAESWVRRVSRTFTILGPDDHPVSLVTEPRLDPANNHSLVVANVAVQPNGAGVTVVTTFEPHDLLVPVGFEVTMRLGDRELPCGSFWVAPDPASKQITSSGLEMRVDLDSLDPAVRDATFVLAPQTAAIERMATVDRIWGGKIVFDNVPLKRLDLDRPSPAGRGGIQSGH